MIKINLLPVEEIKKREGAKREFFIMALLILAFLGILACITLYQKGIISDLQVKYQDNQQEIKKYQLIAKKIKEIDVEKELVSRRIGVIKQLKQKTSLTVHVLDEIASLTPPDRIWLISLTQDSNRVYLVGMALDDQTIAKYMEDLNASPYLGDVHLENATMTNYAGRNLKSFKIACLAGFDEASTDAAASNIKKN